VSCSGSEANQFASADGGKGLVFAGSSWRNDTSRNPDLPAFFVAQLIG